MGKTPTISYSRCKARTSPSACLAPIQPTAILLLSRSGWGLERLLLCTVQQLNELQNGTSIGGVAPRQVRFFERFRRVAQLMRELQEGGNIQLSTLADEQGTVVLTSGPNPLDAELRPRLEEVISLLGVSHDSGPIAVEAPATFRAARRPS